MISNRSWTADAFGGTVPGFVLPSGWQPGDVVQLALELTSATQPTISSGWDLIYSDPSNAVSGNSPHLWLYRRVMQSGDSVPTCSGPSSTGVWIMTAWMGVDNDAPEIPGASVYNGTSASSIVLPTTGSYAPADDSLMVAYFTYNNFVDATPPAEQTEGLEQGTAPRLVLNYESFTSEGNLTSDRTETLSGAGGRQVGLSVFLRPENSNGLINFIDLGNASSATSRTISLPNGWKPGDAAYVGLLIRSNTADPTITGWTKIAGQTQSTNGGLWVYRRILQSGDTTFSATWTTSGASGAGVVILRGVDSSPEDGVATTSDTVSNTSNVAPSVSPSGTNDWLLTFYGNLNSNKSGTPPTTAFQLLDEGEGSTTPGFQMNIEKLFASGATGTRTETLNGSNNQKISATVAVKEANIIQGSWGMVPIS